MGGPSSKVLPVRPIPRFESVVHLLWSVHSKQYHAELIPLLSMLLQPPPAAPHPSLRTRARNKNQRIASGITFAATCFLAATFTMAYSDSVHRPRGGLGQRIWPYPAMSSLCGDNNKVLGGPTEGGRSLLLFPLCTKEAKKAPLRRFLGFKGSGSCLGAWTRPDWTRCINKPTTTATEAWAM